eukprot:CAMPEP_0173122774 /NCGR_PEP_ID=MMETSP1102-20130122/54428_1 /TAXON_ID=49646 /ORGANISM="Geminigera sp., Strain Caron Lab Isolate" /LENGTH=219 /DNA_ID=CAMNT_0014030329 /DNA_START=225 /DNA_END=884 /DNA_ORIENTATION=+
MHVHEGETTNVGARERKKEGVSVYDRQVYPHVFSGDVHGGEWKKEENGGGYNRNTPLLRIVGLQHQYKELNGRLCAVEYSQNEPMESRSWGEVKMGREYDADEDEYFEKVVLEGENVMKVVLKGRVDGGRDGAVGGSRGKEDADRLEDCVGTHSGFSLAIKKRNLLPVTVMCKASMVVCEGSDVLVALSPAVHENWDDSGEAGSTKSVILIASKLHVLS